jgi:hypothetical protein
MGQRVGRRLDSYGLDQGLPLAIPVVFYIYSTYSWGLPTNADVAVNNYKNKNHVINTT